MSSNQPKEYELSRDERGAVDEISRQIEALNQQRIGMFLLMGKQKGIQNASIDYRDGKLIATPNGQ